MEDNVPGFPGYHISTKGIPSHRLSINDRELLKEKFSTGLYTKSALAKELNIGTKQVNRILLNL